MERPEYFPTRADFDTEDDWARYLHEGGFGPEIDGRGRLVPHRSQGRYSRLRNGIYGWEPGDARATRAGPSTTSGLTEYDAIKLFYALAFAAWKGVYLNTHITVTWSLAGLTSDTAVTMAHQQLMDALRRWVQRGGSRDAHFVWVLERGKTHGLHGHIMMHLAGGEAGELRRWIHKHVERRMGRKVPKETTKVRPELGRAASAQWDHWAPYFLKGSDGTWQLLSIEHKDQGVITGKRAGVSRSLDEAAQRRTTFPRSSANLRTIRGNPFDGRFNDGEWMEQMTSVI